MASILDLLDQSIQRDPGNRRIVTFDNDLLEAAIQASEESKKSERYIHHKPGQRWLNAFRYGLWDL